MAYRILQFVLASVMLVLGGCFVDLEREEAALRIFIDGASANAERVIVEVDDGPDRDPFVAPFELNDAARTAGPPALALPTISLGVGQVMVRAQTVDAAGQVVDAIRSEDLVLVAGASGLNIDFGAPPIVEPNDNTANNNTGTGVMQQVETFDSGQTFETAPEVGNWSATVPIDPTAWTAMRAQLDAALGGVPTGLRIQHVTFISEALDEDAESLDDLWTPTVAIRVLGAGVNASVGNFPTADIVQSQSPGLDIDVLSWVDDLPSDARVELTGMVPSDGPELPARIRVVIEVVGSR